MFEFLVATDGKRSAELDELSQEIIDAQIKIRKHLMDILVRYDGSASTFRYIILDALTRQGLSQNQLAKLCSTSTGSVSRWIRGSVPVRLARTAACERLHCLLKEQIEELQRTVAGQEVLEFRERAAAPGSIAAL